MAWQVILCDEFEPEFDALPSLLQDELLAHLKMLEAKGPLLGRLLVDTLKGCTLTNLKELRFSWNNQPFRYLFAFDPKRSAIVLVGGSKAGDKRFYEKMIPVAEQRFARHLKREGEKQ